MAVFNEQSLEMATMKFLQEKGYEYVSGDNLHREASDVLLREDLHAFLASQYAREHITETEIQRAISYLSANRGGDIYESNCLTYRLMIAGFALKRDQTKQKDLYIRPIDFENIENNLFKVVNQFEVQGTQKRIPDAVVFVNGLPVVVFEFKSAVKEDITIHDAFAQLTVRYRRDIPELFKYNAFVVISDGVNSKYGSLFTPYDFFYSWSKVNSSDKEQTGINSLHTMVKGLFAKERLLSVMKDFVFFPDSSKRETKIVCRYPQFFATHKLFESVKKHSRINQEGDGKGGIYFGATGCGKSLTMLFLTRMLMRSRAFSNPTILLITDRTDLDDQLSEQFAVAKTFIGDDCVVEVQSRDELRQLLQGRNSGGVFLTTIQKFTEDLCLLSDRNNIICISDEAHRSQNNLQQQVKTTQEGVQRSYGFAKYLHDSLPNATYVGFTGTPIDAMEDVFGCIVDSYTMVQSVEDGITKPIVYEGRAAKVLLDMQKLQEIEEYYKQCEQEGTNEYQIKESKQAQSTMEKILGDNDRLQAVAEDFIQHYEKRIAEGATVEGKAMFVCANREIAYNLYKKIIDLRRQWNEKIGNTEDLPIERIKLVMTRGNNDAPELYNLLGDEKNRKDLAIQFKNTKSNFKIVIVVDMWITGFDVPSLDTMYIDKPLQRHTLIQTISRVNRVYEGKDKGLIVDYIGIKNSLNKALKRYANGDESETTIQTVEQSVTIVKDELDILRKMFYKFDYSAFTKGQPIEQLDCLNRGAEFIQNKGKEKENIFMGHTQKMKLAYSLCCNSDQISDSEREDFYFFCAVRSIIYKYTSPGGKGQDAAQMNERVSRMIEEAIKSEGVEEIIKATDGKGDKNIDLLSDDYMARLEKLKLPNTKIKLMIKLLKMIITDLGRVNKMKAVDFSKRLNTIVNQYNERKDDVAFTGKVVDDLTNQIMDLYGDVKTEKVSFQDLNISYEEKAFYDILKALAVKYNFVDTYPDEKYKPLAKEIKKIVDDNSKYVDWSNRDDIKAELQADLIRVLSKYNYPPETQKEVYEEVFEQAENFKKYNE